MANLIGVFYVLSFGVGFSFLYAGVSFFLGVLKISRKNKVRDERHHSVPVFYDAALHSPFLLFLSLFGIFFFCTNLALFVVYNLIQRVDLFGFNLFLVHSSYHISWNLPPPFKY